MITSVERGQSNVSHVRIFWWLRRIRESKTTARGFPGEAYYSVICCFRGVHLATKKWTYVRRLLVNHRLLQIEILWGRAVNGRLLHVVLEGTMICSFTKRDPSTTVFSQLLALELVNLPPMNNLTPSRTTKLFGLVKT